MCILTIKCSCTSHVMCVCFFSFQIQMTSFNFLMWDNTSNSINSPVIGQSISACQTENRRKRAASDDVTFDGDIQMALNTADDRILVNQSAFNTYGMAYHRFNLSHPGQSHIVVCVKTFSTSDRLNVFARADIKPTPGDYAWHLTWKNSTNSSQNEYQLYLTPDEFVSNTSLMFVGVQRQSTGLGFSWSGFIL